MNLRSRFPRHQLLFTATLILTALAPVAVRAQDKIVTKTGGSSVVKILGVTAGNVEVQAGAAKANVPLASLASVEMAAPAEFIGAQQAFAAKEYAKALVATRALVEKFKGLPADWTQQATAMLGDIYLALNDQAKAEAAYADFQKLYPGKATAQADLGIARLAVAKKNYAAAKTKLASILGKALDEKSPSKSQCAIYGQAFYLSGQIKEAEGDLPGALEDYLRTATIFPQDRVAAAGAQEKADTLRKTKKIAVP